MNVWDEINRDKLLKIGFVFLFVILATVLAFNIDYVEVKQLIQENQVFGLFLCVLIYAVMGVTPIPSEPLTVILSGLAGPGWVVGLATIGNTLAALAEFYIGGEISDLSKFEEKKAKLPFNLGKLPANSPVFLLLARMLPGYGPKFVSVMCGIYHVPLFTYLWTTLVSTLLGAFVVAFGGYELIQLF